MNSLTFSVVDEALAAGAGFAAYWIARRRFGADELTAVVLGAAVTAATHHLYRSTPKKGGCGCGN